MKGECWMGLRVTEGKGQAHISRGSEGATKGAWVGRILNAGHMAPPASHVASTTPGHMGLTGTYVATYSHANEQCTHAYTSVTWVPPGSHLGHVPLHQ